MRAAQQRHDRQHANDAGRSNDRELRLFSDAATTHPSRELARWMEHLQRTEGDPDHMLKLVLRADRFAQCGGDHTPFNRAGFTAVRLTEAVENYAVQHTPQDLPQHVDFGYLAQTPPSICSRSIGSPTPARRRPRCGSTRAQSYDATITWSATAGVDYNVYGATRPSPCGKVRFRSVASIA